MFISGTGSTRTESEEKAILVLVVKGRTDGRRDGLIVIIGQRSSKSTFDGNNYLREVLDLTHSGSTIDSSSSSYPAFHWAKTSSVKRIFHFEKTLSVIMSIVHFAKKSR